LKNTDFESFEDYVKLIMRLCLSLGLKSNDKVQWTSNARDHSVWVICVCI